VVRWPKKSNSSICTRVSPLKPMRMRSKVVSLFLGVASSHSRPPLVPAFFRVKYFSIELSPASSAAGVPAMTSPSDLTVTCSRSASYSHSLTPSPTITCSYGLV